MDPESPVDEQIDKMLKCANRSKVPLCCGGVCGLIFIILFATSFKAVGPYMIGLKQNTVTKTVNLEGPDVVYDPGVYFVGFWNSFLTFPTTIQTIQYSFEPPEEGVQHINPLQLRSNDAVPISLEVSVQYQRVKAELPQLFRQAMTPILQENIFTSALRAELTKIMSRHNVADCWQDRDALVQEFTDACERVLEVSHATCWGLQFYRVHVDRLYEQEIIATQVQMQQRKIEEAKKNAAEVRSQTQILLANYTNAIKVLRAAGAADRYNLQVAAQTAAEVAKVNAEANATHYVLDGVRLPSGVRMTEVQLTDYQEALMLSDSMQHSPLFYGLSGSAQYIAVPGQSAAGRSAAAGRRLQGAKTLQMPQTEQEPGPAVEQMQEL